MRKWENLKLEDLIAQINSTVHRVMGESGEESEYIEEKKAPPVVNEYRKRYRDENNSRIANISSMHTFRRTKRPRFDSIDRKKPEKPEITAH